MLNKSIIKMGLMVIVMMFAFNLSNYAQDCTKTSEEEIISAIYGKIEAKYPTLMNKINVRIDNGVVTLEGWVNLKEVKKDIQKLAKTIPCVKKIKNELKVGIATGCGSNQKRCGDICIGLNEKCNIKN
jgi:BON domain